MFDSLFDQLSEDDRLSKISFIADHLDLIIEKLDESELKEGADRNKAIDAIISILAQYKKYNVNSSMIQSCCC